MNYEVKADAFEAVFEGAMAAVASSCPASVSAAGTSPTPT